MNQMNKLPSEESKDDLEGSTYSYGLPHFFGSQTPWLNVIQLEFSKLEETNSTWFVISQSLRTIRQSSSIIYSCYFATSCLSNLMPLWIFTAFIMPKY